MHNFFAATGRFAVRFRWVVVVAWLAATVLASLFLPSLSSVQKGNNNGFLPASSPSLQAERLATPFQAPDQVPIPVVVVRAGGTLTATDTAAIERLAAGLARVAGVQRVKDLGVSRDGRAVQLQVLTSIDVSANGPAGQLAAGLRHTIAASALPGDLHAHLAGQVAAQVDANQAGAQASNLGQDLSIVFILVLLVVVFRSLLAPLLTLAPAVLVTQLAGPVIAEGTRVGLQVSSLTEILMLILTLGAGTDYGLFLVFRVREELRAGQDPRDAVIRALSRVGESITFSAATVIAALLTLLLAAFGLYSSLGAPLAIAIAIMLVAGLTLLPALLAIFGRAAFWPSNTTRGAGRLGWWGRTASRVVARPAVTLVLGLLAFGAVASAAIAYTPAGFGAAPAPGGSDAAAGNALLAAHFPAASSNPTNVLLRFRAPVWSDPAPLADAEQRLAELPQFDSLTGPLDVNGVTLAPGQLTALHARLGDPRTLPAASPAGSAIPRRTWTAYRAESQFVSPDGRTVLFNAGLAAGDPGSNAALHQVPTIRASAAAVAISYLAAFGLSVLLFQDAAGADGLPYVIPFLMFLFLLALGEDYNILVMTRIREEAGDVSLRQAVTRALERTGSTVTSAGLVLAGTFGVFALVVARLPGGDVYRDILASLSIGILMDAFLVRTLLVPSTVALLGRWNWWPSRHGTSVVAAPARELAETLSR